MTDSGQSVTELLIFWIRGEDGDVWMHDCVGDPSDTTFVAETRKEVYDRASEYSGQVAEQRVRLPIPPFPDFPQLPVVEGEVVEQ